MHIIIIICVSVCVCICMYVKQMLSHVIKICLVLHRQKQDPLILNESKTLDEYYYHHHHIREKCGVPVPQLAVLSSLYPLLLTPDMFKT